MIATELTSKILALGDEDRAELACLLIDSLDAADPNDFDSDSVTEATRRLEELDSGKVIGITKEELFRGIQADRGRR